jgi:hypothetical protein
LGWKAPPRGFPAPSDAADTLKVAGTNLVLAGITLLLILLTATLFNQTMQENDAEVSSFFRSQVRVVASLANGTVVQSLSDRCVRTDEKVTSTAFASVNGLSRSRRLKLLPDEGDEGESLHAVAPRATDPSRTIVETYFMRSLQRPKGSKRTASSGPSAQPLGREWLVEACSRTEHPLERQRFDGGV